jgi:beta-glucosidase
VHDSRRPTDRPQDGPFVVNGARLGAFPLVDHDQAIRDAASAAAAADVAVVVVGLNADWESEGYDRSSLALPLRTDELVEAVAKANPNTVVVVQSGSAVSMPWVGRVKGVVQAWYGGNEAGNAIADVLYGKRNPSGRMPLTFPVKEEDIAAYANFKSARTAVRYEEGIWVGYKHHNLRKIPALWPFGHGLSYTTFSYVGLSVTPSSAGDKTSSAEDWNATVRVQVSNTGTVAGDHAVILFLTPPKETAVSLKHPEVSLQGFSKVYDLKPGETRAVAIKLDKCECSVQYAYTRSCRSLPSQTQSPTGTSIPPCGVRRRERGLRMSVQMRATCLRVYSSRLAARCPGGGCRRNKSSQLENTSE